MKKQFFELPAATRAGTFRALYSENGLVELSFPNPKGFGAPKRSEGGRLPAKIRAWHRETEAALKSILTGRAPKKLPPLDLVGTDFQKSVWNALLKISPGKTKSYEGGARSGRRVRSESGSGAGAVPSRAGGERKNWRLFRRPRVETRLAGA